MAAVEIAPHVVLLEKLMGVLGLVDKAGHSLIPQHILYTWLVMLILIVLSWLGTRRLSIVPKGVQNLLEVLVSGMENFVVSSMGESGRRVFPFLLVLFVFILFGNLIGLVPGCNAPTAVLNTNFALAISVFVYYNYLGLKMHGPKYIKHFTGPVWWMIPLMLPIELISHLVRPVSLSFRLFGNIFGEEMTLILFFFLLPLVSTLPIYFLYFLIKTLQAFVFFMLSMIYLQQSFEEAH
ncbi:MAG: F0F1 ATP synthase subunit A [Desulfohalobiaceae bacterium]